MFSVQSVLNSIIRQPLDKPLERDGCGSPDRDIEPLGPVMVVVE